MKNLFSFLSMQSLKNNFKNIILRFPIGILIIFIVSGLFFSLVHFDFSTSSEELIGRGIFSLIITFFLSVGTYIFLEGCNVSKIKANLLQLFPIIFGILFYIGFDQNIDNFENFVFFILSLVGIISFLFFAPYTKSLLSNSLRQSVFYTYFYNVSVVFLTSIILGLILTLLGSIGIGATFELFDIKFLAQEKAHMDWIIISLSLVTPLFALTKIPGKRSFNENHFNENVFFSFLVKYIAIPFIYLYFIILYAYTIKVLSNFGEWPNGEVSWMVIGFSIFGYITYIFSYIFEQKNKFISTFRKAFPYVVIPQIFMLSYAIYLRIEQYDITINRYFVVVFGLWLFIISIYYIFSKAKKLSLIVSTLTLFTIIISVGPWSVYNLPENRQLNVLESNLKEAGILVDGKIVPLENYNAINAGLSEKIYSGIDYICDYSDCKKIEILFKDQYLKLEEKSKEEFEKNKTNQIEYLTEKYTDDLEKQKEEIEKQVTKGMKYRKPGNWEIVNFITDEIKVKRNFKTTDSIYSSITFRIKEEQTLFPINLEGFTKIYKVEDYANINKENYAKIYIGTKKIEIIENSIVIKTIDISNFIDNLYNGFLTNKISDLDKENLTFTFGDYKLILDRISIENPEYDGDNEYTYLYANGYLLTK